jgi:hypothetical protein
MEKRDLLDEYMSAFDFVDAILGLAEDNEPISCLAYAVAEKLSKLIEELQRKPKLSNDFILWEELDKILFCVASYTDKNGDAIYSDLLDKIRHLLKAECNRNIGENE